MTEPVALPGERAHLIDTQGLGMDQYIGSFVLQDGGSVALVDVGLSTTTDAVLEGLASLGVEPGQVEALLPTHVHLDHGGATWKLLEHFPNATAYLHRVGAPYYTDPDKVAKLMESAEQALGADRFPMYGRVEPLPIDRVHVVEPDETVQLGDRTLELIDAPGHAPHQYVVHDPDHAIVYTGDAAGIRTPGGPLLQTSPPPAFHLEAWRDTLDTLEALEAEWLALTHFGWVAAGDHLPQFRDQLEAWVDEIARYRNQGLDLEETIEQVFETYDRARAVYDETDYRAEVRMNVTGVWLYLDRLER